MLAMAKGILARADWRRKLAAFALIVIIALCAILLIFADPNTSWTVTLQVASAVAGAALGGYLQADQGRSRVENQAAPAIRHLLDQARRISGLVSRIEKHGLALHDNADSSYLLKADRVSDWLESIGASLRDEINSTTTAIEDWGDLTADVYNTEVKKYTNRSGRMPITSTDGNQEG